MTRTSLGTHYSVLVFHVREELSLVLLMCPVRNGCLPYYCSSLYLLCHLDWYRLTLGIMDCILEDHEQSSVITTYIKYSVIMSVYNLLTIITFYR